MRRKKVRIFQNEMLNKWSESLGDWGLKDNKVGVLMINYDEGYFVSYLEGKRC